MGYRGEIVLVLSKRAEEEFRSKLNDEKWFMVGDENHKLKFNKEIQDNVKRFVDEYAKTKTSENGDKVYYWEWVKWYPEDDINDSCLRDIISNISQMDYLFIYLGEDEGDIELDGNYYENSFDISFKREITCNKDNIENLFK